MIVQCPQCGTGHLLEEMDCDSPHLAVECTKCSHRFLVQARPESPQPAREAAKAEDGELATSISERTMLPKHKKVAVLVMCGPMAGTTFYIDKPEVVIGRAGTDIAIQDPEVSSKHCALEVRGDRAVLTDLGSTNGTFVGEEQIKSRSLEHLSEFRIGKTTMMYTVTPEE